MSDGFAGKRHPAKRSAPFAKERTNVGGHEAGKIVGVFHALLESERANVVAVVECDGAQLLQREHAFDVPGDRFERALAIRLRIVVAKLGGLLDVEPLRNVAAQRIVRAGLVGQQIGDDAAAREFRNHVGAIADQADGRGFALADGILQDAQRLVEIVDHHVAVAGLHAPLDAFGIDVDAEKRRAVRAWRPAAARRPCRPCRRWRRVFRPGRRRNVCARRRRMFRRCPAKFPACRCRSSFRRSSGRTSSGRRGRARRNASSRSSGPRDSNWRSGRAGHRSACEKFRPACRIAPEASRHFQARGATRRWRENIPSCAPLFRVRRTR